MIRSGPRRIRAGLAVEGLVAMLAASLVIRILPFGRLARLLRPPAAAAPASPETIADLRRVLEGWARRLPWRTMCFEQGVAAHWMLVRRRRASTVHYGARPMGPSILAHVWVTSGGRPVIGCDNASEFVRLSQF